MLELAKDAARWTAAKAGARIVNLNKDPGHRLCGLLNLPIRTVLDVGANRGMSAQRFMKLFPRAHVLSFEPQPGPFAELERLAMQHANKMRAVMTALGSDAGEMEMLQHTEHDTSSSLLPTTGIAHEIYPFTMQQSTIKVPLRRLDDVVAEHADFVEDEVLVKLDVQGFELRVMAGGERTMRRTRSVITEISLLPLYVGQPTFREMVVAMEEFGLRFGGCVEQFLDATGRTVFVDAVFIRD